MNKEELFRNKLYSTSPTSLSIGSTTWIALDTKLVGRVNAMIKENKQLKENWNKLKEILNNEQFGRILYSDRTRFANIDEILDKMQELESGDSNE